MERIHFPEYIFAGKNGKKCLRGININRMIEIVRRFNRVFGMEAF